MDYADFIGRKLSTVPTTGIVGAINMPDSLFPHQSALTKWAAKRGRAAIFADTGLGKMRMELVWADLVRKYTGMPVMIHTPLAVAQQLAAEGRKIGIETTLCREQSDVTDGINIINYDRLHKIDPSVFGGVVLDESGCIKHHRICRATTSEEMAAVDLVADRFFPVCSDVRRNARADSEIKKARKQISTSRANGAKRKAAGNPAGNPAGNGQQSQRVTRAGVGVGVGVGAPIQSKSPSAESSYGVPRGVAA